MKGGLVIYFPFCHLVDLLFFERNLTFLFIFKREEKYSSDFFFLYFSFGMLVFLTKTLASHFHHLGLTFPSEKGGLVLLGSGYILTHWLACGKH